MRFRTFSWICVVTVLTLWAGSAWLAGPILAQTKPPITWSAKAGTGTIAAGSSVKCEVSAHIDDGWHLYSLTQVSPPDPTRITVPDGQPFVLSGKVEAPAHDSGFDQAQGSETEYYTGQVTFRVPVTVSKGTAAGKYVAHIKTTWQACSGSLCLRPQTTILDIPLQVTAAK